MSQEKMIWLACEVCGQKNYTTNYSKKNTANGENLEIKKHCPKCNKHTLHKQIK